MEVGNQESAVIYQWSARKIQPIVVVYVALVFLGFIAMSFFVFHSRDAIKALIVTGVGSVFSLLPSVLTRDGISTDGIRT